MVLCYHAVSDDWDAALSVTPTAIEEQLSQLCRRGWHGATFTEAVLRPPHRRTLAVTFDDAFLSVLERALPILTQLGLPATVFVPTTFMARRQRLLWAGIDRWADTDFAAELEGMNWEDLRLLVAHGWEIGSHTRTHPRLPHLDDGAARHELERSRAECEERLGEACTSIAYPYGHVDQRILHLAGEVGYAVGAGLSSSLVPGGPLRWPRIGVYHADQSWRFWLKTNPAVRRIRASRAWPAHE